MANSSGLLVDDEPFDLRYGTLHHTSGSSTWRAGLLHRVAEWESPAGRWSGCGRPGWSP